MKKNILLLVTLFLVTPTYALTDMEDHFDHFLRHRIKFYNIHPLKALAKNSNSAQVELGERLFSEKKLSGNRRMACSTCHNPKTGTSDLRPMSQSENGKGILRRNSIALFNIGSDNKSFMFWDGRIHYNFINKFFTTPEIALNGKTPNAPHITKAMTSALSAQAIFPLVTHNEMLGEKGENEIADAKNNLEAWDRILFRLKNEKISRSTIKSYTNLFQQAYPLIPIEQINIGHVGESIAAFEREKFQSLGSPFQGYLRGDNNAMTYQQKKGLIIFLGVGKCINCHQGSELGNHNLFSSNATPQWGESPLILDKGRAEIVKDSKRNFFFKVPSLLNISLTAPYMHNGAFQTLTEVIDHYNHISGSLNDFDVSNERRSTIPVEVEIEKKPQRIDEIWLSSQTNLTPKLRNRLILSKEQKYLLGTFLKEALTDPEWLLMQTNE